MQPPLTSRRPDAPLDSVFLVGCPRSGTSWVQTVLAQHPDVVSPPETYLMRRLGEALGPVDRPREDASIGPYVVFDEESWAEALGSVWVAALERLAAAKPGARIALEKSPMHALVVDEIRRMVPGARFVHLVRDPRDVVRSMRHGSATWADGYFGDDVIEQVRLWTSAVDGVAAADGPDVLTVRYEDLRTGPDAWRPLFDHVGIDPAQPLPDLHASPGDLADGIVRVGSRTGLVYGREGFSFHDRRSDPPELAPFELTHVLRTCDGRMRGFGYEPQTPPMSTLAYTAERRARWAKVLARKGWAAVRHPG